ncbi:MAG: hypothetical protein C0621_09845 [Desulfuromonas sp.]|nr:MAG: hypothetical protein C0621_09845 [Desulfuromonas sp.]
MAVKKKKKSTKRSPAKRRSAPLSARLPLAAGILAAVAFLCLGLTLLLLPESPPPAPTPDALALADPTPLVQQFLDAEGVTWQMETVVGGAEGLALLVSEFPFPGEPLAESLQRYLHAQANSAVVEVREAVSQLAVTQKGNERSIIQFAKLQPPPPPSPPPPVVQGPRLALIMDDLGRNLGAMRQLLALPLAVTVAILPGEPHAAAAAEMAQAQQHEVMLHIPMEPQGYPAINPGYDALFVDTPKEDLVSRFEALLAKVPQAVGGNNHMGSRFTRDVVGMRVVLNVMKERGLYFVDSRTVGSSVAFDVAQQTGVPSASRDVFLDNVAEVEPILDQLAALKQLAERRGTAIGICHPYPQTLEALRYDVERDLLAGVEVVFASQLVH